MTDSIPVFIQVAPIAVYTSGKGSSAAGLTASVQRDTVSVSLLKNTLQGLPILTSSRSANSILKVVRWFSQMEA